MNKKVIKTIGSWALFLGLLIICLKVANAQSYLGEGWDRYLEGVRTFAPSGKTGEELAMNFVLNGIRIIRYVVGAVALIFGVLYATRIIFARGQEEKISEQKKNFLYAFLGFVILIISENVASIFNPESATTERLIDFNAARDQLRDIVDYIKWLLGSIIILLMAVSSIKLIAAQGNEEVVTTQKRNLTWSFVGMLIILLASNIVNAIYVINSPKEVSAASPETAISEAAGVIRLILVFLGPLAVAFTIYAGLMYLTALDNEEVANKAKRMIVAGVTAIVIIYSAYAIVNTLTAETFTSLITPYIA